MNAKFVTFLLFIATILASCSNEIDILESQNINEQLKTATMSVNQKGQQEANRINGIILNGIKSITRAESNTSIYPEFYGGSFIEKDGTLRIYIKGDSLTAANQIKSVYNSDIIHYVPCLFSFSELSNVTDSIGKAIKSADLSIRKNISAYGIDEESNRVIVYLLNCSSDNINIFKTVYNHPSLKFEELDRIVEDKKDICPGDTLFLTTYMTETNYASFAFRAREKTEAKE